MSSEKEMSTLFEIASQSHSLSDNLTNVSLSNFISLRIDNFDQFHFFSLYSTINSFENWIDELEDKASQSHFFSIKSAIILSVNPVFSR